MQDPAVRRQKRAEDLMRDEAIPEGDIEINLDLVIGSGGAGKVYMANYAGVNAAAKVLVFCFAERCQFINCFRASEGLEP